jgi:hypothetical protein
MRWTELDIIRRIFFEVLLSVNFYYCVLAVRCLVIPLILSYILHPYQSNTIQRNNLLGLSQDMKEVF